MKHFLGIAVVVLGSLVPGLGCGGHVDGAGTGGGSAGQGGSGGGSAGQGGADQAGTGSGGGAGGATTGPAFSEVYQKVIAAHSCAGGYCHGGGAGGLDLGDEHTAYQSLVGVVSATEACGGNVRVVAGHPEQSLLFLKVAPSAKVCGNHMPKGAPLPAAEVELIRAWIQAGAAN